VVGGEQAEEGAGLRLLQERRHLPRREGEGRSEWAEGAEATGGGMDGMATEFDRRDRGGVRPPSHSPAEEIW